MELAGRPIKALIWPVLNGLMVVVCLVLTLLLFGGGQDRARKAYDEGRMMGVSLQDGTVDGLPLMTPHGYKPPEPEKTKNETMPDELPPVSEPRMESGLPGKFSNAEPEVPISIPETDIKAGEEKPTYPEAVKAEPETQKNATAAPVPEVEQKETPKEDMPLYAPGRPLAIAPEPRLIEKMEIGDLPKIGDDGTRPSAFYAKPFELPITDKAVKQPLVAVIMTGLGLGRYTTDEAMKLPPEITFSFSPYARDGALWIKHARDHGHETMMDLPMQTADFPATDPGPYAITNLQKPEENVAKLHQALSRFSGYTGLVMPAKAAVPEAVMLQSMLEIAKRGLFLVDQPGIAANALDSKKQELGLKDITTEAPVDAMLTANAIDAALMELTNTAKTRGYAVGIARPYPITVKKLREWQQGLKKQGVTLVPVSTIAERLK